MSCVDAGEMREIEAQAFRRGIEPGELMDQAAAGIAARLLQHFPKPGTAIAYIGKGNNGGDALGVLDRLHRAGWQIALRASHPEHEWSTLSRQRLRRLTLEPDPLPEFAFAPRPLILLDALLGIGAQGPLRSPLLPLAQEIAELRQSHGAQVVAIDLPSGLDAATGEAHPGAVVADLTMTIGVPKRGLFADQAGQTCGRLFLVPLEDLPIPDRPGIRLACPERFPDLISPRPHDFHKGDAGRLAVIAGSPGMSGAASLCTAAALRAGAGLVTLHLDPETRVTSAPEVMVRHHEHRFDSGFGARSDARVIGPGLGDLEPEDAASLFDHLAKDDKPTVLDADALNLIASNERHDLLKPSFLITPHPGEFARLAPDLVEIPRPEAAARFVERYACTLLLKGTRSIIASPGEMLRINPTGHAGMASGGQGDVLAGVCGAMLAAGHLPGDAAMLGAWLCGRASERSLTHGAESEQSTTATDTINHLGAAFSDWRGHLR